MSMANSMTTNELSLSPSLQKDTYVLIHSNKFGSVLRYTDRCLHFDRFSHARICVKCTPLLALPPCFSFNSSDRSRKGTKARRSPNKRQMNLMLAPAPACSTLNTFYRHSVLHAKWNSISQNVSELDESKKKKNVKSNTLSICTSRSKTAMKHRRARKKYRKNTQFKLNDAKSECDAERNVRRRIFCMRRTVCTTARA